MGSSYSNYCDSLKKWFKPYGEAMEEARENVPPKLEKDDWNCLVDLWSKQDYMNEKIGHSPNRIVLFDITRVQANGQAVNEPTHNALVASRNLTTQVNEGALQIS